MFLTIQVETLKEQGAAQALALQAAEAAAAQLVASQAEVETLREQSTLQLPTAETAAQELLAAQAEVRLQYCLRSNHMRNMQVVLVDSLEKCVSWPELFGRLFRRSVHVLAASLPFRLRSLRSKVRLKPRLFR